jgi:Leucine-rich repeat (LRR) protein
MSVGETFNAIKYLPNLREFSAWIGNLEDGSTLDDFDPTFLPNLESLSISRHFTPPVFNRLSAVRSLKDISVNLDASHKFDFNVFRYMALERMNLDAKYMTAECWQSLAQLTKLTALAIESNEISEHVTYLAELTGLQRLYLSVKQTVPAQYFLERRFTQVLFLSVYPALRITPEAYSNNFPSLRSHNIDLLQA